MENNYRKTLNQFKERFPEAGWQFEMAVEASALEVIDIAKQISSAIGEISIIEAKEAIIREFRERLMK